MQQQVVAIPPEVRQLSNRILLDSEVMMSTRLLGVEPLDNSHNLPSSPQAVGKSRHLRKALFRAWKLLLTSGRSEIYGHR